VLRHAAMLLRRGKSTTQRELFYMDVHFFSGGQTECNAAILNACAVLNEPRHCLGIVASSRGFYTGRLRIRHAAAAAATGSAVANAGGGSSSRVVAAPGAWHDPRSAGGTGAGINSDWITHCLEVESDAQFILVVEKDGAFARYNNRYCLFF
jgi:DNA topoisomerase VI subunit A